jgi:2-oxo-4-hydroxy-4-carboxy--5-ureidoimidazoline (OHCU) decarboxylase
MSNMQQMFALQTQVSGTQNIVQSEGAATRAAILEQTNAILDKLCQQEVESLRAANVNLQSQLNMANLAASQTAQTQQIISALTPAA